MPYYDPLRYLGTEYDKVAVISSGFGTLGDMD